MKTTKLGGGVLALAVALGASAAAGQAKPPAGKAPPAAPAMKLDVKEATEALKSSESPRIETALVNIRMAGKAAAKTMTQPLVARLKAGLPKELLKKGLETLGEMEDAAGAEACEMYMDHRDGEVRLSAVKCLGGSKGPAATKALREALGDMDPRVHGTAATLLGETKSSEAVLDLVLALDKGVNEAAVSIGQLCTTANCDELLSRMKSKPFDVISSGLQQVLARKDIADDYKKKVITAVRELASQKAREFLEGVRKAWPPNGSKPIADALDKAIKDLEGASK